ncbi:MAG: hypothetical protein EXQ85_05630 [Alphaproteobacteria bacterium]|nr:hypothetical protein [Alphaproteobacteria bacterium]
MPGTRAGCAVDEAAEFTDRVAPPVLESYTREGQLVNRIRHNPAWDRVAREVYERGAVGLNYTADPAPYLVTFAMGYLLSQSDVALHCLVTMTGAVAYVIDRFAPPAVRQKYLAKMTRMDGQALSGKTWATELHGGSDVGATTTIARRQDAHIRLNGLKWFTSNANGGLAVAPPPTGFKLMMEALEFSRIHNAMGSVGVQRRAFLEAVSYLSHRAAFGHPLLTYPMIQDELVKMLTRLESGCALAFAAAEAFDQAHVTDLDAEDGRRAWLRMVTALAKFQTAEDANVLARSAIELMGGNAYTYDYVTPRLLRDAQVLTVWEGPANIQALEVLRMIGNRAPGFAAFEQRVGEITESAPEGLGPIVRPVSEALGLCRRVVDYVRGAPKESSKHARKLLVLLADTLEALLLLEEAIADWRGGDARKALVARAYMDERLAPARDRRIGPGHDWSGPHFDALIGYEPIPLRPGILG